MSKREKDSWMGVFLGPILVFLALCALWKNETRFDYHRAARKIEISTSLNDLQPEQPLAYTGVMNPEDIVLKGQYVEEFVGQLVVYREAEIYAWDRDEDSDGDVTWSRRWMSSIESNSRNTGFSQELSGHTYLPTKYEISDLSVESQGIEFVDSAVAIQSNSLRRTAAGQRLSAEGNFLYLRKGVNSDGVGDERLSYTAIPVPRTATYFGKWAGGTAVADRSHERTNFINKIIQDTGILHHIVAGERDQALATMKSHITKLKWLVRGIGTFVVVFGFLFTFGKLVGFLFHIPVVGQLAEAGVWAISLGLGIPLSLLTIMAGYLAGHPIVLMFFLVFLAGGIFLLARVFRKGRATQRAVRSELEQNVGHQLNSNELKEMEYVSLAHLVQSDPKSQGTAESDKLLSDWSKKHRWDDEKQAAMKAKAQKTERSKPDQELRNLIRIAIADGTLTAYEMRTIQAAAAKAGYDRNQVRDMMANLKRSANLRTNVISNQPT